MGRFNLGSLALVLAFAALGLAILPRYIIQARDERKTLADKFQDVTDQISAELEGKPQTDPITYYDLAAVIAGFLGIILGVLGWVRQPSSRMGVAAVAVSCAAILWRFFATG